VNAYYIVNNIRHMHKAAFESSPDEPSKGIEVDQPFNETYDAVIVGSRIAGLATAVHLARQDARVLVVDRATFPAPTVSCPIFYGNSMAMLERLGVLDAVEALQAPKIRYYGTRIPHSGIDLVTRLPDSHGRDYAYSVRRELLDTAILRTVQTYPNITIREGCTVRDLVWGNGRVVGIRGRQGRGPDQTIYAHAVIGADGKHSLAARATGAEIYDRVKAKTCIFYAYYRNIKPIHEPSAIVYVAADRRTGVLVFDADNDLTVISVGIPVEDFAQARRDPEATLERTWRSIDELAERGLHAERATPVMGQAPVDSYYRQSYGPGWALVGDAGHYIDPVTGQGINNALRGAELLAEAWSRTRRRADWMSAMAEYQRQRDQETRPIYNLVAFGEQMERSADMGIDLGTPLFRAIARQPYQAQRYVGIFSGATTVAAFFNPFNIASILIEDGLRYQLPQMAFGGLNRAVVTAGG
jgi:2-polyprenyl-6-methoxyphenol hydroxylase-like FAD-dependent oxidoreductase